MNTKLIGALLAACVASLALPVFAGNDSPASGARASGVMKASHREHSATDGGQLGVAHTHSGVGGVESGKSQSGKPEPADSIDPMYRGG